MIFIIVPMLGSDSWASTKASSVRLQKKIPTVLAFASLTAPNHFFSAKDLVLAPCVGTMKIARPDGLTTFMAPLTGHGLIFIHM